MKRIEFKAGPEGLENKFGDARVEVKASGEDGILHIKAYALAFGNIDSWGDIIMPGACDEFLKSEDADRMALCYQHDRRTVIGKITDKGVDDYGMWIEADILPTTAGKDAAILLKSGAVKEFSIGYRADKYHFEKREGYEYDIRILDAITVYEVSPVTTAANRAAILVSAKSDPNHDTDINPKPKKIMTPEEIKAMQESIEKAATEKVAAELNAKTEEIKAQKEKIDAAEKSIDNLDKTVKAQQATIDELKEKIKEKARQTFFGALKETVEEHKEDIENLLKKNSGSLKVEFKTDYDITVAGDITRIGWGGALDAQIAGARAPIHAFYETLPKDNVNALFIHWLEGTFTDQTGYVDELAAMADENAAAEEKSRKMAKGGSHILISSEVTDFFGALYEWARSKAQEKLDEWADGEIFDGAGADTNSTTQKKVYSLKSQSTAFSALGEYQDANAADVIWDAVCQAKKEGFNITHCFVPWADYASLLGIKDLNGRNVYDPATGTIKGARIVPSSEMSADTMLLADINVARIKQRPVYELEIVRNAKLDGWDVYVRKSLQVLVKGPDQKGVIWVASVATAIASINSDGPLATLAGAVNDDGQIETHPNS